MGGGRCFGGGGGGGGGGDLVSWTRIRVSGTGGVGRNELGIFRRVI